jgi:hypothetical protein
MCAVDGKYLELLAVHIAYPAGNIRGLPIGWIRHRVSIGREARLSYRKLTERAEGEPGFVPWPPFTNHGRKDIADDRHCKEQTDGPGEKDSKPSQQPASRKFTG